MYCITLERTQRIALYFDASDDKAAEARAEEIFSLVCTGKESVEFDDGDCEFDYSLGVETDPESVVPWD